MKQVMNWFQKNTGFIDRVMILTFLMLIGKWLLFLLFNEFSLTASSILFYLGFLIVAASFGCLLGNYKNMYLFILNLLMSINLFANTIYISHFGTPLSIYTLLQVNNVNGLGGSIFVYLEPEYFLFFIDFLVILILKRDLYFKKTNGKISIKKFLFYMLVGVALLPLQTITMSVKAGAEDLKGVEHIEKYSLVAYQLMDVYNVIKDSNETLDEEEIAKIEGFFQNKHQAIPASTSENEDFLGFAKGKNLIFIQAESLQNFVINKTIEGQEITPHINRLLGNSLYFSNFYPQTIEGNSSDAELLTQTSLYPVQKGAVFYRYPENTYLSLANLLKKQGYRTIAVHGDEANYWNRDKIYPSLGFDEYWAIDHFVVDEEIGMGMGDKSMFLQTAQKLEDVEQPFYSFIITLTNHMPFDLPKEHRELDLDPELDRTLLGGYLQSVHYMDQAIGAFFDKLEDSGLLEDSLIVLYGDHDGLFEKDKPLLETYWEGNTIDESRWITEYVPVPLIIYHPDLQGKEIETVGAQIDVLPTVASLMGIDGKEMYYPFGENMLLRDEGFAIIPQGDYSKKPSYRVEDHGVYRTLNEDELQILDLSDLIIRGNFLESVLK